MMYAKETIGGDVTEAHHGRRNRRNIFNHRPALQLIKSDPAEFNLYYNQITKYEMALKYYNFWLFYCKDAAGKLIADIQKTIIWKMNRQYF